MSWLKCNKTNNPSEQRNLQYLEIFFFLSFLKLNNKSQIFLKFVRIE